MVDLSEDARRALAKAQAEPLSYAVRLLRAPDGRLLAVLGEAHVKLARAAAIGRDVVAAFELRGVETFQRKQVAGGAALGVLITAPRTLLRAVTLGAIRGSTIVEAKQLPEGYTVELERTKHVPLGLHVASLYLAGFFVVSFLTPLAPVLVVIAPPLAAAITSLAWLFQVHMIVALPVAVVLRRRSWSWMIHPFLGILSIRDELMVAGTVRMLEEHPDIASAVVVMGRAHVSGFARRLVEQHGFRQEDLGAA
jgi:hypothetical protein